MDLPKSPQVMPYGGTGTMTVGKTAPVTLKATCWSVGQPLSGWPGCALVWLIWASRLERFSSADSAFGPSQYERQS